MEEVSFEVSDEVAASISLCVDRGVRAGLIKRDERTHYRMNLTAARANGCPIDFDRLLSFDAFSFAHDITGIDRHIDRNSGRLGGCFVPRSARPA